MIEFSHVYKTYSDKSIHALRDLNLSIPRGSITFLTGPSGAGKTTLFKLLCGYEAPSSGRIQVGDCNLEKLTPKDIPNWRRKIGIVFQDFKLLKDSTVFENVSLPLVIKNQSRNFIRRRVAEVLEQVGLSAKTLRLPDELSGGEQQRAAIARAIIHQPELLIADEPTGNLDPELTSEIMDLFERVCAQGTTVFIATHDLASVHKRGHRNIQIFQGEVANP
jgi:cell division transport system ATP-binding protein